MSVAATWARGSSTIGEVLTLLKREFPDISISKIRFLETQGLVTPQRTASGYRKFTEADIERLRYVLREQQEHFLPLKVIKEKLERGDEVTVLPAAKRGDQLVSRSELQKLCGLTESRLRDLEQFGLLQAQRSGSDVFYDEDAVAIAQLAAKFLDVGVEPRHLRQFRNAVDREADLYRQVVVALRARVGSAARAEAEIEVQKLQELGASLRQELLAVAMRS